MWSNCTLRIYIFNDSLALIQVYQVWVSLSFQSFPVHQVILRKKVNICGKNRLETYFKSRGQKLVRLEKFLGNCSLHSRNFFFNSPPLPCCTVVVSLGKHFALESFNGSHVIFVFLESSSWISLPRLFLKLLIFFETKSKKHLLSFWAFAKNENANWKSGVINSQRNL